ncbi:AGE family epimerase/isomerase [Zavarzinia aquatilis]|uniref:Mannose-6-phosphate isomerase n=1 Tax=Zavarzinia aquatilis TaxID=2211142 RepID=A0A317EGR8_9PROT|nr:AGE family epimerase/isomerase [Zavarzinia aquatilis]PWR25961.1 mannose-6-phosphate isomerase [Zavarzinia aquatilis]
MTDGMAALSREFHLLRDWLFEEALPLWSDRGLDREHGGFFEKLNPDGRPTHEPRRARVTGRQVYAFAIAGGLGWRGPAEEMMRYALDNLFRRYLPPDGMVISTVDAGGAVVRADFDLYDHAFILFGLAAAAARGERTGELSARAARLRDDMIAGWSHPVAGFEESQPRSLPLKANPHMHILEAALAWMAVSDDPGWGRLADGIAELCLARFIDPATGALREYFDGDWQLLAQFENTVVEPGHQFEWSWLMRRWGALRGRADALAVAERLAAIGEGPGVCPVRDLAMNELNADLSLRDGLCRLWPQTERIKAHVAALTGAADADDRNAAAVLAARAASGLRRYFDHPLKGAWWEHLGIDGKPLSEPARTTSLYHIVCAINEVAGVFAPAR